MCAADLDPIPAEFADFSLIEVGDHIRVDTRDLPQGGRTWIARRIPVKEVPPEHRDKWIANAANTF